jgi:hypothetical protein
MLGSVLTLVMPASAPAVPQQQSVDPYTRHLEALRKRLPGSGFTVVEAAPFVVIGDESPEVVRQRARQTVGWAVEKLKESYFTEDPSVIIDVWLFKDRESYENNLARLWGETPSTPFGYYSSRRRALVMNISTGSGTLVHEIVHPFMEANFPDCPDWFNEGLASLYEQCGEDEQGRIHGFTNWRLEGLQKAIRGGRLQTFEQLTSRNFYGDDDGTNYAMARYLCYYLQQQGKLRGFYRDLVTNSSADPSGYLTLQKCLDRPDMEDFQSEWESYVMKLRS